MTAAVPTARIAAALAAEPVPVVLTGGGGWLGQVTLHMLDGMLGETLPQRVQVYGSHPRVLTLASGRSIPCQALPDLALYEGPPPLLLHYACLTKDRVAGLGAQAFLAQNAAIRDVVSEHVRRHGSRGIFLPSSGAVYGPGRVLTTDTQGNPYGVAKLLDEARFADLAAAAKAPLVLARVFNLAGPFINKPEAYALASFLVAILAGRGIEIRAAGRVVRSYLHVEDLLLLALGALLLQPQPAPVRFDTVGELEVEVEELARRAAALLGRPETAITRASFDGRAEDRYVGEGAGMHALARTLGLVPRLLDEQVRDTAAYLARRS